MLTYSELCIVALSIPSSLFPATLNSPHLNFQLVSDDNVIQTNCYNEIMYTKRRKIGGLISTSRISS